MKKIVAFGASSSVNSINKQFASFVANKISNSELIILDLNDFEMPIYSEDRERFEGIPSLAYDFKAILKNADGIIISFAEHNGSYTAAFKNIFDWISRIEKVVWFNKPMLLLATSDGEKGASSVLETAYLRMSYNDSKHIFKFSLPRFSVNFDKIKGILDNNLKEDLENKLYGFQNLLS
jgi:chromate reductase